MPENVTSGPSTLASFGPMPRTRCNPSSEPYGPFADRSATIRAASAGPMRGSRSSVAESAWSISTGPSVGTSAAVIGMDDRRCD